MPSTPHASSLSTSARVADAALTDQQTPGGTSDASSDRRLQRHLEGAQIAVVDPDDGRLDGERSVQLLAVVHFEKHVQAQRVSHGGQARKTPVGEQAGDEKYGRSAEDPGLVYLILVDDEVLAKHGEPC